MLTFDLDFGDLVAASGGQSPSVILFQMRNQTQAAVTPRLMKVLAECEDALTEGALIVVEDGGYRVRRAIATRKLPKDVFRGGMDAWWEVMEERRQLPTFIGHVRRKLQVGQEGSGATRHSGLTGLMKCRGNTVGVSSLHGASGSRCT